MATFRESIYEILHTDAVSGTLATLLGYNASTKPRCVFYGHPPEQIDTPLLTYMLISADGDFPRRISLGITVWGGDFDAIFDRLYVLLHEKTGLSSDTWKIKSVRLDFESPEIWDESLKVYYKQLRYMVLLARIT